jgi:hypothetical protein
MAAMSRTRRSWTSALVALVTLLVATAPGRADEGDDEAYSRLVARGKRHYLRAALEEGAMIGGGALWYWIDRERQVADWDFPSLKERVTFEAWRFDTNPFPINFAWHPFNGAAFHLAGRANDLSLPVSVGYGLVTSLAWEFGLEFREKFSINDGITTTGAGMVWGEFVHWLGRYFESAPSPRSWHRYARWGLTPVRALHNAMDDVDRLRPGTEPDALGFSNDIAHRFRLSSGVALARARGDLVDGDAEPALGELRVAGELVAIPGYLRSRHLRRVFADGNVIRAGVRVTGAADAQGLELSGDLIVLGWHRQDLDASGAGNATTIGVGLAYRYRKEELGAWVDRVGQMHLPGLAIDQTVRTGPADVRARLRLHPDFAGLHPGSYHAWDELHPDAIEKTILTKHGYYYGWGATARLEVEASLTGVELGGSVAWSSYTSHEGLDRAQEDVELDVASADTVLVADGWVRVAPLGGRMYLEGRVTREDRDGNVGEVESSRSLTRLAFAIGAAL